jgi:hypothetical protein
MFRIIIWTVRSTFLIILCLCSTNIWNISAVYNFYASTWLQVEAQLLFHNCVSIGCNIWLLFETQPLFIILCQFSVGMWGLDTIYSSCSIMWLPIQTQLLFHNFYVCTRLLFETHPQCMNSIAVLSCCLRLFAVSVVVHGYKLRPGHNFTSWGLATV